MMNSDKSSVKHQERAVYLPHDRVLAGRVYLPRGRRLDSQNYKGLLSVRLRRLFEKEGDPEDSWNRFQNLLDDRALLDRRLPYSPRNAENLLENNPSFWSLFDCLGLQPNPSNQPKPVSLEQEKESEQEDSLWPWVDDLLRGQQED
jgi:hypothetical protein